MSLHGDAERRPEREVVPEGQEKRGRAQEAGNVEGQRAEERANAAEGRAKAEEQRGIGDAGRVQQMVARSKARAQQDEKEKRGRGRR